MYTTCHKLFILSLLLLFYRCGPLSNMWCMRYEAKHSYFKQLARVLGNFKNIAKNLAEHHQLYMCYNVANATTYLRSNPTYPPGNCFAMAGIICMTCSDRIYTHQTLPLLVMVNHFSTTQCNLQLLTVLHVYNFKGNKVEVWQLDYKEEILMAAPEL